MVKKIVLCPIGGLGNLIFQYICALSLSISYNSEFYIFTDYETDRKNIIEYKKIFKCDGFVDKNFFNQDVHPLIEYCEPFFTYTEIPNYDVKTMILRGYFQSWKYFYTNLDKIRKTIQSENNMRHTYENLACSKKTVCVHVRRGDYLNVQDIHPVMDEEYYNKAMSEFSKEEVLFLVFAEDQKDSFRKWEVWKNSNIKFVENVNDALDTFFLMSLCDYFIIANSSLSLCAYYFRENHKSKIVVPSNWFGPNGPSFDINDLIKSENYIII